MARQIIVLEQLYDNPGTLTIQLAFWFPVTNTANRRPQPGLVSRAASALAAVSQPITAQEQTDLESGGVREEFVPMTFPTTYTTQQLKDEINARYSARAAAVAAEPAIRAYFGVTFSSPGGWSA